MITGGASVAVEVAPGVAPHTEPGAWDDLAADARVMGVEIRRGRPSVRAQH